MRRRHLISKISVFLGGVFVLAPVVVAEDITLQTYYPSPRGFYDELRSTHNTFLGSEAGSAIGVGTETPIHFTSVNGPVLVGATYVGANQAAPYAALQGMLVEGNVGVGTVTPLYSLAVAGSAAVGNTFSQSAAPANSLILEQRLFVGDTTGVAATPAEALTISDPTGSTIRIEDASAAIRMNAQQATQFFTGTYVDTLRVQEISGGTTNILAFHANGSLGVGTTSPSGTLHVSGVGNVALGVPTRVGAHRAADQFALWVQGNVYARGNFACTAIDVAEAFPMSSMVRPMEPGDVVMIDREADEMLKLAAGAYNSQVAGVITTEPGIVLGDERDGHQIALVGRVPVKASTENGPIRRGDLLVSASTPGLAMRGDASSVRIGMVIGKAMSELDEGEGEVWVLVNLH